MSERAKQIKAITKQLQEIDGLPLQVWLDRASKIEALTNAVEGIYCGESGRIHVPLDESKNPIYLTMGWHTVSVTRVEYAYVS